MTNNIGIFTPYGPFGQESGLLYLLASHLAQQSHEIVQLRCNGVFATCERDSETNWRRDFSQCFQCIADQQHLQRWSGIRYLDLSQYVTPELVEQSRRVLNSLTSKQLGCAVYDGLDISALARPAFQRRLGNVEYDADNKRHEQVLRTLIGTTIRMYAAGNIYLEQVGPDYLLLPRSSDILTSTLASSALKYKTELVTFRWDVNARAVIIKREQSGKEMMSELVLDGVANMRADRSTWPPELIKVLDEIAGFLELQEPQLSLPIASPSAA